MKTSSNHAELQTPFPTEDQIASLAYHLWLDRGCPEGSADEDWLKAESELKAHSRGVEFDV